MPHTSYFLLPPILLALLLAIIRQLNLSFDFRVPSVFSHLTGFESIYAIIGRR